MFDNVLLCKDVLPCAVMCDHVQFVMCDDKLRCFAVFLCATMRLSMCNDVLLCADICDQALLSAAMCDYL
jgi:hypothetical protein